MGLGHLLQCCFTSTETVRAISDGSPGRPPRLSPSSWVLLGQLHWPHVSNTGLRAASHRSSVSQSECYTWNADYPAQNKIPKGGHAVCHAIKQSDRAVKRLVASEQNLQNTRWRTCISDNIYQMKWNDANYIYNIYERWIQTQTVTLYGKPPSGHRSTSVVRSKAFEKPLKTRVHTHAKRSHSHVKDPVVHVSQSSVDYENTPNNPVCTKTNKSVIKESSYNVEVEHNTKWRRSMR